MKAMMNSFVRGGSVRTPTCRSFPSAYPALPPTNTPSRVMAFPGGSCFISVTLMTALGARSDSTAAASSRPVWPNTTCRAAMSSQGQRPASLRWETVIALAAAADCGRTSWTSKLAATRSCHSTRGEKMSPQSFFQSFGKAVSSNSSLIGPTKVYKS